MRVALLVASLFLAADAVATDHPPCEAPISTTDVAAIKRALRTVTSKPILLIMPATEDKYFPGAIIRHAYVYDARTNKSERIPQYTRKDLVYVYMRYTDRSQVDVYAVRKIHGRWQIEEKKDWFI